LAAVNDRRGVRAADLDDRLQGIVSASDPGLVGTRSGGSHGDWADVLRRAAAQGNRFLRELRGPSGQPLGGPSAGPLHARTVQPLRGQSSQPCTYLASCYVPRPAVEAQLAEFVAGERPALIVV